MSNTTLPDITHALDDVHGGGKAGMIAKGARAAWDTVRPWLSRADSAVETFGKYAGGALAAKEGYDLLSGGNKDGGSSQAPAPQPSPSEP